MRTYGNGRPLSYSSFKAFFSGGLKGYVDYCTKERKDNASTTYMMLDGMLAGSFSDQYYVIERERLPFPEKNMGYRANKRAKRLMKAMFRKCLVPDHLKAYQTALRAYQWLLGISLIDPLISDMLAGEKQQEAHFKLLLSNGISLKCIAYADSSKGNIGFDLKNMPLFRFNDISFYEDWCFDLQVYFYCHAFGWEEMNFIVVDTSYNEFEYKVETKTLQDCRVEEIEQKLIEFSELWNL